MRKYSESIMKSVFKGAACVSILVVLLICYFLFSAGIPTILKIGVKDFVLGKEWSPGSGLYGIFPIDRRKHLCYHRGSGHWGANRNINCGIYGEILQRTGL